jgi:catechol 2,3-dioxygenase-like lactoylglutathione lyase family enzyme
MTLRSLTLALACAATTLLPVGNALAEAAQPAAAPATSAAPAASPTLGTVGIGVKDLKASAAFYADVLGMQELRRYELGYIDEIVMGYPGGTGTSVVLMHWPNDTARRYDGNDVKLVFYVDDPKAVIERIRAHGLKIDREATPIEVLNGRIVGMGRDPDGYVIEVLAR